RITTLGHDLCRAPAVHTAARLAPLVIVLFAFAKFTAWHGPAFDVLGSAGNLHALGRLGLQLKQPPCHVQAIGILPRQGLTVYLFFSRVGPVRPVDRRKGLGQSCLLCHTCILLLPYKEVSL